MSFVISRSRILRWVLIGSLPVLLLGLVSEVLVSQYGSLPLLRDLRHFTFNSEHNMPSWLSSGLLGAGALLTLWIAHVDPERRRGWTVHAAVLLACSIDESVSFHEALITIFAWMREYSVLLYFPWVIFGATFCLFYGIFILRLLSGIGRDHFMRFAASGVVFVFGALVMEVASGTIGARYGEQSLAYALGTSMEDILETFGAFLYLRASSLYALERMEVLNTEILIRD